MQRLLTRRLALAGISAVAAFVLVIGGMVIGLHNAHPAQAATHFGPKMRALMRTANHPLAGPHGPLLNHGDSGDDQTSISPTLSALCQSLLPPTPDPYHNPAPNVDAINGDTLVQAGSQTGCDAPQNETAVVVNPFNARNIVAGANDYRVFNTREGRNDGSGWAYTSFDGGKTWRDVLAPHLTFQTGATGDLAQMDSAGDPALSFGPHNTVYYANLVFSRSNEASGVAVSVSHNGGLTFGKPHIVHTDGVVNGQPVPTNIFNDKEWVAADPFSNTVYLTWTEFTFTDSTQTTETESPIVVSVSHDGGNTWSAPVPVTPTIATFTPGGITPFSSGSQPIVGPFGTLYVAYESAVCQTLACDQPTDHDETVVATSHNGGKTFTQSQVDVNFDFPFNPDVGRSTLTNENFRINSFPTFAIDRVTGLLYVAWADDRNGQFDASGNSIKTNGDVFGAVSADGAHWFDHFQVGTSADEVFPGIAAEAGHVDISFYTRAFDPNGINLDYAQTSTVGLNFKHAKLQRITTQSENPQVQFLGIGLVSGQVLQGEFIGDYSTVAIGADLISHPVWTDFRGNPGVTPPNQDVYTQAIPLR